MPFGNPLNTIDDSLKLECTLKQREWWRSTEYQMSSIRLPCVRPHLGRERLLVCLDSHGVGEVEASLFSVIACAGGSPVTVPRVCPYFTICFGLWGRFPRDIVVREVRTGGVVIRRSRSSSCSRTAVAVFKSDRASGSRPSPREAPTAAGMPQPSTAIVNYSWLEMTKSRRVSTQSRQASFDRPGWGLRWLESVLIAGGGHSSYTSVGDVLRSAPHVFSGRTA